MINGPGNGLGIGRSRGYMAFCEISQDQSPGTGPYAGDFGWKLITSDDPEVKKTKLNVTWQPFIFLAFSWFSGPKTCLFMLFVAVWDEF